VDDAVMAMLPDRFSGKGFMPLGFSESGAIESTYKRF
jgi:hypothetical protein